MCEEVQLSYTSSVLNAQVGSYLMKSIPDFAAVAARCTADLAQREMQWMLSAGLDL